MTPVSDSNANPATEFVKVPRSDWDKLLNLLRDQSEFALGGSRIGPAKVVELATRQYENPAQEAWENRLIGRLVTPAMQGVRMLAAGHPLPRYDVEQEFVLAGAYVGFAAFADEQLKDYVAENEIRLPRDSFWERIEAVNGTISNSADLHGVRELRNKIAHDVLPPAIGWDDVDSAIGVIETALCDLGILAPAPVFKVQNEYRNAFVETPEDGLGEFTFGVFITMDGLEYRRVEWVLKHMGRSAGA